MKNNKGTVYAIIAILIIIVCTLVIKIVADSCIESRAISNAIATPSKLPAEGLTNPENIKDTEEKESETEEIEDINIQDREIIEMYSHVDIEESEFKRALNLFNQLKQQGKNSLISPLSINMAFTMLANGANGDTLKEIEDSLGIDLEETTKQYKKFIDTYKDSKSMSIANAAWVNTNAGGVNLKEEASEKLSESFNASIEAKDFSSSSIESELNTWVSEKTNGMITKVVDDIPDDTVFALINAIYFDGKWSDSFDKESTTKKEFTLSNGKKVKCDMMVHKDLYASYYETNEAKAFSKVYETGESFMAILPKEGQSTDINDIDILKLLDSKQKVEHVNIEMPKFKYNYDSSLVEALENLGIKEAFNADKADFRNMFNIPNGTNVYINTAKHLTAIDMTEEGTEASGVTYIGMVRTTSLQTDIPKIGEIKLDRPFYYMIVSKTGEIMFIGDIENPTV